MKKKIAILLTAVMALSIAFTGCKKASTDTVTPSVSTAPTAATTTAKYKESPYLAGKGLPAITDRLPKDPKLTNEMPSDMLTYEIGTYGGTLRTVTSAVNWDADVFVANNEALLNTPGILGKEVTPNVLKGYEVSSDEKEFTFKLRTGLKWSDGEPVTMEDFRFVYEDILMNAELTPIFPAWLCSGGVATGTPGKFTKIDEETFKIAFDKAYGGFVMQISIGGWKGYTDLLKPSKYLKPFHKKFGDAAKIDALLKENKFDTWIQLFTLKNANNWDLTGEKSLNYPCLYPWMMTKKVGNVTTFERNPYYFKVDSAGNQLPYIDKIESTLVQDIEMVGMKTIAGEVDFSRESASLIKMSLYKENEKNGYKAILCNMHVTPTDILFNQTYKDPTFRVVVQDVRFRKAISLATDRKEITSTIYYGYAEAAKIQDSTFDLAAANKLLDDMGMKKGADGFRLAPDGKPFSFIIEVGGQAPDIVPLSELIVQQWKKLSINVSSKRIESSLWSTKNAANELQCSIIWTATPLWYYGDWGFGIWAPLWNVWRTSNGTKGEEPPANVKTFYAEVAKLLITAPANSQKQVDVVRGSLKDNLFYLIHLENVKQPLIVNAKLGNVSDKGFAIATNFALEQAFFKK